QIEPLHLARRVVDAAQRDAARDPIADPRQHEPAARRRVVPGKRRQLVLEVLEAEADPERSLVLEEQLAGALDVRTSGDDVEMEFRGLLWLWHRRSPSRAGEDQILRRRCPAVKRAKVRETVPSQRRGPEPRERARRTNTSPRQHLAGSEIGGASMQTGSRSLVILAVAIAAAAA